MSGKPSEDPTRDAGEGEGGLALALEGKATMIGSLPVARALPARERRSVGPFVFLDHMGPVAFGPNPFDVDVRPHPHIGLSTVTYLFDGIMVHRDSLGSVQAIRPGAINLMTAGRGIVHSERLDDETRAHGGSLHGLQLWLALPTANEEDAPSFSHHADAALPRVELTGATARVLLGEAFGARSPVAHPARPTFVDLHVEAGAAVPIPDAMEECALYVVDGEVTAGARSFGARSLLVRAPGATLSARTKAASRLVIVGGTPVDGPRYLDWNFVSSSRARLEQAKAAWRAQTFPKIPGDDREFIPLPALG